MSYMTNKGFLLLALLVLLGMHALMGQQGDEKEKQKNLLSSLNWRKWSSDVVPLYTPQESLAQFTIAPGCKVELVAHEPMVKDPVFVEWDDEGRMWVGELRTYMMDLDGNGEDLRLSRVMVLEDLDRDGVMDKATPFLSLIHI